MPEELTYVIITPYSIAKSRTGGILGRIMARAKSDLVAATIFAPSQELANEYADSINFKGEVGVEKELEIQKLLQNYVKNNFAPDPKTGLKKRVMFLLFKGENAVQQMREDVIGYITNPSITGETIRDTYADFVQDENGETLYFEPAVLTSPKSEETKKKLLIWAKYADQDAGVFENMLSFQKDEESIETTLVLIKPDNFENPSIRIGNIIDLFSKSGLRIIGTKVVHMSVNQGLEFYGPVKQVFLDKLKGKVFDKVQSGLNGQFDFEFSESILNQIVETVNPYHAECEFNKILKFMTGLTPNECQTEDEKSSPGTKTCLALIYQGPNAVSKIRDILGTTDPSKAKPATVRKEFGSNIMVNTAHASDSQESFVRETKILNINENHFKQIVENEYHVPLKV